MKMLLFLSFVSLSFVSSAKVESWKGFLELLEKDDLKVKQVRKVLEKLKKKKVVFPSGHHSSFNEYCSSTIGFQTNFERSDYNFTKLNDSNQEIYYQLNICSFNRKVVFFSLVDEKDSIIKKAKHKEVFFDLLKTHNTNLGIDADTSHHCFNPLFQYVVNTGYECAGTEFIIEIWELVKTNNRKELLKWCHSLSPEVRCYGAIGFLLLEDKKIVLTPTEKTIIELIKKDKTIINYCDSCDGVSCETTSSFLKRYTIEMSED